MRTTLKQEEMIERLRSGYAAYSRHDFDSLIELWHPDVTLVRAGDQGELTGAESVRAWMEPDAFSAQVLEPVAFEVEGNRVLVHVEGCVRGASSEIRIEIEVWSVWTFDDRARVTKVANFLAHEEDEARRALRSPRSGGDTAGRGDSRGQGPRDGADGV
jgi:ketosteroid isomerase-like protein